MAIDQWVATNTDCKHYDVIGMRREKHDGFMRWQAIVHPLPATPGGHTTLILDDSGTVISAIGGL